ncbi:hypothetical protein CK203_060947 [Vitis vinifera]|uniref:Uncharacterized protein n=1 Tax=Vitis vinifera TaxID=29760 RepID=A0A438GGR8_VITVI|nr:hypothetical protein CK203_060947 [Vitis vinifera]
MGGTFSYINPCSNPRVYQSAYSFNSSIPTASNIMASVNQYRYICLALLFVLAAWASHAKARNLHEASMYERHEDWMAQYCTDPSPWETRGTQLMVTRGTCYQPDHHYPDHHHPDSPKDMHGAAILSGTPQGKANDVSASPIQGRANDAGRA